MIDRQLHQVINKHILIYQFLAFCFRHPLDDPKNCTGNITFHWPQAPDGSGACVLGAYRAYFYSVKNRIIISETNLDLDEVYIKSIALQYHVKNLPKVRFD